MNAVSDLSIKELLKSLRRRRSIFVVVVLGVTTFVTLIGLQATKLYTAGTTVVIEPRGSLIEEDSSSASGAGDRLEESIIETQIRLARSWRTMERAVETLGLDNPSGDFLRTQLEPEANVVADMIYPIADWFGETLSLQTTTAEELDVDVRAGLDFHRDLAIKKLQENVDVSQLGASHVLSISYSSPDPQRAAEIANAIAEGYIENQLEDKLSTSEQANSWLTGRVEELRQAVSESEETVERYRVENNLTDSNSDGSDAQILKISLIEALAEVTTKNDKLKLLKELWQSNNGRDSEALNSPLMSTLRQREVELLREEAQLAKEFGKQHPRMRQLDAEKQNLAGRIDREILSIVKDQEDEVALAQSRMKALQASLGELQERKIENDRAAIRLRELERKASAVRTTYESYLVRLTQTQRQQQVIQADVHVLSAAQLPDNPSSASPVRYAAVGFTLSIILGLALAIVMEQHDSRIRSTRQLEKQLKLPALAMVPTVKKQEWKGRLHGYLSDQPRSAFAESIHRIYMRIKRTCHRNGSNQRAIVALVTSALPSEGKTSLAAVLAAFGAKLRQKTLLIDLDLRHPSVFREFDVQPDAGKFQGNALEDMVQLDTETNVEVLTIDSTKYNPAALLESPWLIAVLQEARARYDWVILDAPPVLGMTDATLLAPLADSIVFVVKWNETTLDAVQTAIDRLENEGDETNTIGTVLNQVDLKRHANYQFDDEGKYYDKYSKYYLTDAS